MSDKLNKCIFVLVVAFIIALVSLTYISMDSNSNETNIAEKLTEKSEADLLKDNEKLSTSDSLSSGSRIDTIYGNATNNNFTNSTEYILISDTNEESDLKNNTTINETSADNTVNDKLIIMDQILPRKPLFGDRILPETSTSGKNDYVNKDFPEEYRNKGISRMHKNEVQTKVPPIAVIPFPYRSLLLRKPQIITPYKTISIRKSDKKLVKNGEQKKNGINDNFSSSLDSIIDNNINSIDDSINKGVNLKPYKRTTRFPQNYHQNYITRSNTYRDYYSSNKYSIPTTKKYYNKNNYFTKKTSYSDDNYAPTPIPAPLEDEEYIDLSSSPLKDPKYGSKIKVKELDDNNDYRTERNFYQLNSENKRPQKLFNENLFLPQESPQEQEGSDYEDDNRDHEYRDQNIPQFVRENNNNHGYENQNIPRISHENDEKHEYEGHNIPQIGYENNKHEYKDQISPQIPYSVQEDYTEYPEIRPTDHYSDDQGLKQYPESHTTVTPHEYYNQNEDEDDEEQEDDPYIEPDILRIPKNEREKFPTLKGQRIPKLYEEHNPYVYSSERPDYESYPESTPSSGEYTEPIPPSNHYGGDSIEEEPDFYTGPEHFNDRPRVHPFPHISYHESPSNSPPLAVIPYNNDNQSHKHSSNKYEKDRDREPDHNNNNDVHEDESFDGFNNKGKKYRKPEDKTKSNLNKNRNNTMIAKARKPTTVSPLTQLFLPQTEVLSEIHTLILPVKITYPSKLTSPAMRNVIENLLSRV